MKEAYNAGLDVHKDTVQLVVPGNKGKEPVSAKCLPNDGIPIVGGTSLTADTLHC
jgi:hypothetical protein